MGLIDAVNSFDWTPWEIRLGLTFVGNSPCLWVEISPCGIELNGEILATGWRC